MKKILCLFIGMLSCTNICLAQIHVTADERVELTTIVARLTGMSGFVNNDVAAYAADIDAYFGKYREHELIQYLQQLRRDYHLAYNAMAGSAMRIEIDKNGISLHEKTTLSEVADNDKRWTEETFAKYITLLDKFYKETNFHCFYEAHSDIYAVAEKQMNDILGSVNTAWFKSFYGKDFLAPTVYVALGNGRSNYIVNDFDAPAEYAIMIGCGGDQNGMPQFNSSSLDSILHEICHYYTHPLFLRYWEQMEQSANMIYLHVWEQMLRIAYGDAYTMTEEWLNNLFKIMYFKENSTPDNNAVLSTYSDMEQGYIWMERAVNFMDNFYANRDYYKDINSFMPMIVEFFKNTANDFEKIEFEYENRNPYVVSIFPSLENIYDFIEAGNEVRITFSEPMSTHCYSYTKIANTNYTLLPVESASWENQYTFVLKIAPSYLEKGKEYGVQLNPYYFLSTSNYPLKDTINIIYNTHGHENL